MAEAPRTPVDTNPDVSPPAAVATIRQFVNAYVGKPYRDADGKYDYLALRRGQSAAVVARFLDAAAAVGKMIQANAGKPGTNKLVQMLRNDPVLKALMGVA